MKSQAVVRLLSYALQYTLETDGNIPTEHKNT